MSLDIGLVAHNVVRRDGQGRVMVEITRALAKAGHRVTVYARTVDDDLVDQITYHPLRRAPGPQLIDDLFMIATASRATRSADHDITMIMGACALPNTPFVYNAQFVHAGWRRSWTRRTRPSLYHRLHARIMEWVETRVAQRATKVIASTSQVAHDLVGSAHPTVAVVPDGIDLDEFPPVTPDRRQDARRKLDLRPDAYVIGFLGEYHTTRKGLDPLLEAVALRGRTEELVIAARGNSARLRARIRALGVGARVHVVGFADPRDVIAASDAVAVPSLYEPFSLVALETAASAVPVIISSAAGAAALVEPGAVIVEAPPTPQGLRDAIDGLRRNPAAARALGQSGRQAAERFGWDALAAEAAREVVTAIGRTVEPRGTTC